MELILLKIVDNFIASKKSLSLHALCYRKVIFFSFLKSMLFFFTIKITTTNTTQILIIASLLGAFSSALPVYLKSKNKANREDVWLYSINSGSRKKSKALADNLRKQKLDVNNTSEGFNHNIDSILIVNVIAHNSDDSNKIMNTIPKGCRVIIKKDIEIFNKV